KYMFIFCRGDLACNTSAPTPRIFDSAVLSSPGASTFEGLLFPPHPDTNATPSHSTASLFIVIAVKYSLCLFNDCHDHFNVYFFLPVVVLLQQCFNVI